MKLFKGFRIAIHALLGHPIRTALSLVGIIIGVAAVILMVAVGQGAQKEVLKKIENMGTNLLVVSAGQMKTFAGRTRQVSIVITLVPRDAMAISSEVPGVAQGAPAQGKRLPLKYETQSYTTQVVGTTYNLPEIKNISIAKGRFFNEEEDHLMARVVVLGPTPLKNLFGKTNPIGEMIRIKNVAFEVIGVTKEKGMIAGQDEDDQVFIPLNTAMKRLMNVTYLSAIYLQARSTADMKPSERDIKSLLRERHRLKEDKADDFTIQNQLDILEAERETTQSFTLLIGSIAGVSLLVGGVGILAVMLILVRERTNEIGVRRAVGARRKDILLQFMMEATSLSIGGGIAGILIGLLGSFVVRYATKWPVSLSVVPIIISFGFSFVVGLFFGVYPARKASRLDPIVALRAE
jgi:putative ABC transport system permease protein